MYGMSDEISGQSERIIELKKVMLKCDKYIRKLPNKNTLEKEMIITIIDTVLNK
jgi:hypothetical protein